MKIAQKLILLMVVIVFTFSACSVDTSEVNSTPSTVEDTGISLIDQAGREVTLEEPAQTIVSTYYITTYATIALDVSDKLIGLENKAESRPIYALSASELLELPQVGSLKEFNLEAVAELKPDLVLMPVRLLEQANTLNDLGINTLVVDPETKEGLELMMQNIATATGSEARLQELLQAQDEIYSAVATLTDGKEHVSVYMGSNSSFLETATANMYQNTLITEAGGQNVFSDIDDNYWTAVSYEAIIEKNPDVIIIPTGASYTVESILADKNLVDVYAVANNMVYQMPTGYEEIDSPVPSGVLGVYWLSVILHGSDNDISAYQEAFSGFYSQFYGFEIE